MSEKQHRLISNIGGAVLAAVVVGAVFYTFGYSGEQRGRDFLFLNGLSVTFLTSAISSAVHVCISERSCSVGCRGVRFVFPMSPC